MAVASSCALAITTLAPLVGGRASSFLKNSSSSRIAAKSSRAWPAWRRARRRSGSSIWRGCASVSLAMDHPSPRWGSAAPFGVEMVPPCAPAVVGTPVRNTVAPVPIALMVAPPGAVPTVSSLGHELDRGGRGAARSLNLELVPAEVRDPDEFEPAFRERGSRALIVVPSVIFTAHAQRMADQMAKARLPAMFFRKENVEAGGLMSYGARIDPTCSGGLHPMWTRS